MDISLISLNFQTFTDIIDLDQQDLGLQLQAAHELINKDPNHFPPPAQCGRGMQVDFCERKGHRAFTTTFTSSTHWNSSSSMASVMQQGEQEQDDDDDDDNDDDSNDDDVCLGYIEICLFSSKPFSIDGCELVAFEGSISRSSRALLTWHGRKDGEDITIDAVCTKDKYSFSVLKALVNCRKRGELGNCRCVTVLRICYSVVQSYVSVISNQV